MTPIKRVLLYIFDENYLRLRITWGSPRISLTISIGYKVDRAKWTGERAARNSYHFGVPGATINRVLKNIEDTIDRAFLRFEQADKVPSAARLRDIIQRETPSTLSSATATLIDEYIRITAQARHWMPNTIDLNRKALACLAEAFPTMRDIASATDHERADFIDYLAGRRITTFRRRGCPTQRTSGMTNSTINQYLTLIRTFLRYLVKCTHIPSTALLEADRPLPTASRPVIYLTPDELRAIEQLHLTGPEARVRQAFLFSCLTGLRFSDLSDLRWSQITPTLIFVTTHTTCDRLDIDLNAPARRILRELRAEAQAAEAQATAPAIKNKARRTAPHPDTKVFNLPPHQHYNRYLRHIAELAHIDTPVTITTYRGTQRHTDTTPKYTHITSHTGRKTFVVSCLSAGILPTVIMKWTGHKTYASMQPYIDVAETSRRASMSRLDNIFSDPQG